MKLFLAKKLRVALAVMAFAGCTAPLPPTDRLLSFRSALTPILTATTAPATVIITAAAGSAGAGA